jgi:NADPH:quinone reductase-like Zn-dependent oxidoreductase
VGALEAPKDAIPIGLEIAGTVRHVGGNVRNVSVGDRVLAMPPSACAKSVVTVPYALVEPIPENMSFVDAATMPICYATVIDSLINIGQLEKGQVSPKSCQIYVFFIILITYSPSSYTPQREELAMLPFRFLR